MKDAARELAEMAVEMRKHSERLALEAREGGKQSKDGFEKVLTAIHHLQNVLFLIPEKLEKIAEDLRREIK